LISTSLRTRTLAPVQFTSFPEARMSNRMSTWSLGVVAFLLLSLTGAQAFAEKSSAAQTWRNSFPVPKDRLASSGTSPFFVLEPGTVSTFEGKEDGKDVSLVITVLNETKMVDGETSLPSS